MNPRWRTPAALAFLLAVTAGFYWKLTISREYTYLESPDLAIQVRPWLDYQAREFHAGRFPVWDPYEWAGQPLIGQVQPATTNPLNWILFAMPLALHGNDGHIPIATLHWYWVLIHWLGAAFCYALCRDLKAGVVPSLLGACIFALTGFIGHTDWPQFLMTGIWIPLVVLFFARVVRGQRPLGSAALCGAAMGMQFLSGHHTVPVFTVLLMGGLWLWYVAFGSAICHRLIRHRLILSACCLATLALVSAAVVLPAVEYGKQAVRWVGVPEPVHWNQKVPFSVHSQYSLRARSLPGLVIPSIVIPGFESPFNPFVGIVAVAFALAAVGLCWRSPDVRICGTVALGGLLVALGNDFPLYRLIYSAVPMVEKAREPAMAVVISQVGIAALAALGLTGCCKRRRSPTGALSGTLGRPGSLPYFVFVLFLIEAVTAAPRLARFDRPGSYFNIIRSQQDIAVFLKAQPGWFRFEVDEADIPYNFGVLYGLEQFGGSVASMLWRVHRILGHDETPRLFGVQYRVARTPSSPAQVEVFQSRSGLRVYRDSRIAQPLWSRHRTPCSSDDRLRIVTRQPEVFIVEADMACAGQVVAGDPWFPGWRAWVDGKRVPIQAAEEVVRGVPVDRGHHRIEFRFRPGAVYWGAGLSALGFMLVACANLQDRKKISIHKHNNGRF